MKYKIYTDENEQALLAQTAPNEYSVLYDLLLSSRGQQFQVRLKVCRKQFTFIRL